MRAERRPAERLGGGRYGRLTTAVVGVVAVAAAGAGCGATASVARPSPSGVISAVGAENEYANVLGQIGGRYVHVVAVLSNPNTDPHTFEASPKVAEEVTSAELVVENGLGYDTFMARIEAAAPSPDRKVIDVQQLLGLPDTTPNPHLWYDPSTMPAVARAMTVDLSAIDPAHAAYFQANLRDFDASMGPWLRAIAQIKSRYAGTPVATTEPVGDYLLAAMGLDDVTPFGFQADVMNGVDPSPQDVSAEQSALSGHRVKVFCYNQQVVDSLTAALLGMARSAHVPVVGLYETMPTPGYDYQSWMLAETLAVGHALESGVSTARL
jgi:zinc/manganese transport system substrate-binding protein